MTKRDMALGAHFKNVIAASFLTLTIAAAAIGGSTDDGTACEPDNRDNADDEDGGAG